jgi:site-specific recombinase XerD
VRRADLRRFFGDEATRRPPTSSQARTVAALKCFFHFLLENEQMSAIRRWCCGRRKKREALLDVLDLEGEVPTAWFARVFNSSATDVRTLTVLVVRASP